MLEEWQILEKILFLNFKESIKISKKYKNVQILWASTREPYNYIQAKQIGCHLITAPPQIIEKIENFGKNFQKLTIDTVKGFLTDSKKSKFKIINWLRGTDLNRRPQGYEPCELPGCSTPR